MYAFVDRHPDQLSGTGRLLLWAMRGWSQAALHGACPPMALHRGFLRVGATSALGDFHIAMVLITRDAREKLQIAPMSCSRIAEDEALLLALWRSVGAENANLVDATLKRMVEAEAAPPIARAMTGCCTRLVMAGFDPVDMQVQKIED